MTLLADTLIVAVIESTDDLDEILINSGVITGIALALLLLTPMVIDLPILSRNGSLSAALMGPAGVFFALKGTGTPRWLKWVLFAAAYVPTVIWLVMRVAS